MEKHAFIRRDFDEREGKVKSTHKETSTNVKDASMHSYGDFNERAGQACIYMERLQRTSGTSMYLNGDFNERAGQACIYMERLQRTCGTSMHLYGDFNEREGQACI